MKETKEWTATVSPSGTITIDLPNDYHYDLQELILIASEVLFNQRREANV